MSRITKRKVCQTGRLKDLIILNRGKNVLYLTVVLEIITHEIFLIKTSKGIKVIHRQIQMVLERKNLLITTVITIRIMNEKNQ